MPELADTISDRRRRIIGWVLLWAIPVTFFVGMVVIAVVNGVGEVGSVCK